MVSRSLEKMMLIAVGLSTAVIIGVPVLLYAIDTMSYSTQVQSAQIIADEIFAGVRQVDNGELNNTTIETQFLSSMYLDVALEERLYVGVYIREQLSLWWEDFDHPLVVSNLPTEAGNYQIDISMVSNVIHIVFSSPLV